MLLDAALPGSVPAHPAAPDRGSLGMGSTFEILNLETCYIYIYIY